MEVDKANINILKDLQQLIIEFLDNDSDNQINFHEIKDFIEKAKIQEDQYKLSLLLHMISIISNNHHRSTNFFEKIFSILDYLSLSIKKYFSSSELFDIFEDNKKTLLFLVKKEMIIIDTSIIKKMSKGKYLYRGYLYYFSPEIKQVTSDQSMEDLPDDFEEKREIGENDSYICQLIRNDNVKEFISYHIKTNCCFYESLPKSKYETNTFLIDYTNYIEYAAFFGSMDIFNYIVNQNVYLPPSLWLFAIHSQNSDLIHKLEALGVIPSDETYNECFIESIKCHHNYIANYFLQNYIQEDELIFFKNEQFIKYFNFSFFEKNIFNYSNIGLFIKYDYLIVVQLLLEYIDIDVNSEIINNQKIILITFAYFIVSCHFRKIEFMKFAFILNEFFYLRQIISIFSKFLKNDQNEEHTQSYRTYRIALFFILRF